MKKILVFCALMLFFQNLVAQSQSCPDRFEYKLVSEQEFKVKVDSVSNTLKELWADKKEMEKQGIYVDFFGVQGIFFGKNCSQSNQLDFLYNVIDVMIKDMSVKVRLEGSLDFLENKTNPSGALLKSVLVFKESPLFFFEIYCKTLLD